MVDVNWTLIKALSSFKRIGPTSTRSNKNRCHNIEEQVTPHLEMITEKGYFVTSVN